MDVAWPILDVIPGPRGRVLATLVRLAAGSTGRAVAAQAGVPPSTAARVLDDLVEAGLVEAVPAGRATLYRLNRGHLAASAVCELAGVRMEFVERLRRIVGGWLVQPAAAWLFGSTARGDGDRSSDIDLLVVAPDGLEPRAAQRWRRQVDQLAQDVTGWTGNDVQFVEHTRSTFASLEASGASLVDALRREGIELVDGCWAAVHAAA